MNSGERVIHYVEPGRSWAKCCGFGLERAWKLDDKVSLLPQHRTCRGRWSMLLRLLIGRRAVPVSTEGPEKPREDR